MSWDTGQTKEREIQGLDFKLTCLACPEQYDVFLDDEEVGYIRLRHGVLSVDFTPTEERLGEWDADVIYPQELKILTGDGNFSNEEERNYFLNRCAEEILKHIHK